MKTLNIDLNKLSDEELKMYLQLKAATKTKTPEAKTDTQVKPKKKKYKRATVTDNWVTRAQKLEPFLKANPLSISAALDLLNLSKHGPHFARMRDALKKVYGNKLIAIGKGARVSYSLPSENSEKLYF